jgi:NodT family efflux transporter outer membrane factor (OMF) lipoprotein
MGFSSRSRGGRGRGGRRARPLLLVVGAAALFGGCTEVGPNYLRPEAAVNDGWMTQQPDGADAKEAVAPDTNWWESFSDPTLTALVKSAYGQNLTLRTAGLRVIEARARRGIAVGQFFPQVQQLSGSYTHNHPSENGPALPESTSWEEGSVGIDAAWELDFWGKFRRGIESADADVLASVADYDAVLVSLVSDVATNYILIRAIEEQLGYSRANVELQKDTLALTDTRFKAGAVSELDVATARATLANTQALVPFQENDLRQTKLALCVLLGHTPSELDAELAGPGGAGAKPPGVPVAPTKIASGIPADLLRRRPDVRAAERFAAAQSARIGVAKADLYPSISIKGSTGYSSATVNDSRHLHSSDIADSDSYFGFVGLAVNWPVLNWGRIENNIRVQDAVYEESVAAYQQSVLQAAADVEGGLSVFVKSRERLGFLTESVAATQRSVDLSLIQYRTGATDFIRVNTAQSQLVTQQIEMVSAQAQTALGAVRTFRALGGGWEIREGAEFVDQDTQKRMTERTNWGEVMAPDWEQGKDLGFPRPKQEPERETEPAQPAPAK